MATKPLTSEAIALTEKKMGMTLDEIIKMSKKPAPKAKNQRVPNKSQKFFNGGAAHGIAARGNPARVKQFIDSRSSVRQGALAQRRSNFQADHFPFATEVARKAVGGPTRNRPFNRRTVNWNKPRTGAPPPVHRIGEVSSYVGKQQQQQPQFKFQANLGQRPKQRAQTLDSLFANMKEQRMRVHSHQNGAAARRGGFVGGIQREQQQRPGYARGWSANGLTYPRNMQLTN